MALRFADRTCPKNSANFRIYFLKLGEFAGLRGDSVRLPAHQIASLRPHSDCAPLGRGEGRRQTGIRLSSGSLANLI